MLQQSAEPYDIGNCDVNQPVVIPNTFNNTVRPAAQRIALASRPVSLSVLRLCCCLSLCWLQYYFPAGMSFQVSCSSATLNLTQWQQAGYDANTVQLTAPPLADTIELARQILGFSSQQTLTPLTAER